jgi:hypothetical protein
MRGRPRPRYFFGPILFAVNSEAKYTLEGRIPEKSFLLG